MSEILSCNYIDCYYNDNLEKTCIADNITVAPTGICETMIHCDDYECSNCEQYNVCKKNKKTEFLQKRNSDGD